MLRKMQEVLDAYPTVKGWQVMSDEGGYMFPSYRGSGCRTRPRQRKLVLDRLRDWFPFSNSSPVEGIVEAIRTYYSSGRRISLYVLGDEFTGSSIDSVVRTVDLINREDQTGDRRVRIPRAGISGATRRAAIHECPVFVTDAGTLRAQRRHVRRPERTCQLPALGVR